MNVSFIQKRQSPDHDKNHIHKWERGQLLILTLKGRECNCKEKKRKYARCKTGNWKLVAAYDNIVVHKLKIKYFWVEEMSSPSTLVLKLHSEPQTGWQCRDHCLSLSCLPLIICLRPVCYRGEVLCDRQGIALFFTLSLAQPCLCLPWGF